MKQGRMAKVQVSWVASVIMPRENRRVRKKNSVPLEYTQDVIQFKPEPTQLLVHFICDFLPFFFSIQIVEQISIQPERVLRRVLLDSWVVEDYSANAWVSDVESDRTRNVWRKLEIRLTLVYRMPLCFKEKRLRFWELFRISRLRIQ